MLRLPEESVLHLLTSYAQSINTSEGRLRSVHEKVLGAEAMGAGPMDSAREIVLDS